MDQAETLRRLVAEKSNSGTSGTIFIGSATSGVGKTMVCQRIIEDLTEEGLDVEFCQNLDDSSTSLKEKKLRVCEGRAGLDQEATESYHQNFYSLIVTCPDRKVIEATGRLIKILRRKNNIKRFGLVVNRVTDIRTVEVVTDWILDDVERFIDVQIDRLGGFLLKSKEGKFSPVGSYSASCLIQSMKMDHGEVNA